jgi:hypothetical protein
MSVTIRQQTEEKTVVELAHSARLSALLSTYQDLKSQADVLVAAMAEEKQKIFEILQAEGYEKAEIDGVPCTIVRGTSTSLDKIKFVQLGGSLAHLENATISKPKRPYLVIGKGSGE